MDSRSSNQDNPITSQPQSNQNTEQSILTTTTYVDAIRYLKTIDKLYIQQNLTVLEVLLDIEVKNKYTVANGLGQKVFLALEESGCCMRFWCGPRRSFEMHIVDNSNTEVIRLVRHMRCMYCPFWFQKLEVFCPTDVLVGYVQHQFSLLHPRFGIYDKDGVKRLDIEGPICACRCCRDVEFQVKRTGSDEVVGTIVKQWRGFVTESFTDADSFRLEFPVEFDVNLKMILMGAAILIDYMFYERNKLCY